MKIMNAAAALSVAALALAGCAQTGGPAAPAPATPAVVSSSSEPGNFPSVDPDTLNTTTPVEEPTTEEVPTEEPTTEEPAAPTTVRFGQTWSWEDGTTVTVSKPTRFTPSEYAAGNDKYKRHVMFTITVKNGADKKLDLFSTPDVSSGDEEASEVYDSEKGLEGSPSTAVLPGRSVKFKVGYGVKDPADIVMEYSPSFDYEDAIFTSK